MNLKNPRAIVIRLVLCLPCFLLAFSSLPLRAADVRVVSQTVAGDEWLLAVAEPAQVAALSHLARDPEFSGVAAEAKNFPVLAVDCDAEGVLRFAPTLVLFADYSRPELVAQVRRAGVRTLVFDRYATLAEAHVCLRAVARELGPAAEARAGALIESDLARVAALRARLRDVRPARVIAPSVYGVIPGDETNVQDLCDHAAAENLAATLGGLRGHAPTPSERLLGWPVDAVIVAGTDADAALEPFRELSPFRFLEAVRKGRAAVLPTWQLSCVSHRRVDAYERLARALHPEVFVAEPAGAGREGEGAP